MMTISFLLALEKLGIGLILGLIWCAGWGIGQLVVRVAAAILERQGFG